MAMQLLLSSEEARRTYTQPKTSDYTFFIVFAAVFAGMWGYSSYESSRMHGLRVGRAALEKLMKEVRMEQDFVNGTAAAAAAAPPRAVDSSGRAVFMSQSCPICLEDFPSPAAEETLPDPRRPMALQVTHTDSMMSSAFLLIDPCDIASVLLLLSVLFLSFLASVRSHLLSRVSRRLPQATHWRRLPCVQSARSTRRRAPAAKRQRHRRCKRQPLRRAIL